ncbi:MAG: hypothetical protein OXQ29_26735 [Rhodospirillaceae bacterium]|nr:hypothetical protein [Rhodospirillaceae bacterium]
MNSRSSSGVAFDASKQGEITAGKSVQRIHWCPFALYDADLAYATLVYADLKGPIQRNADVRHTIHATTTFDGPIL